ncbi:MAG: hypothetical protein ABSE40_24225 [Candidatus Sulfotelmatobacter sp.]|jgi:hypothetical protein
MHFSASSGIAVEERRFAVEERRFAVEERRFSAASRVQNKWGFSP